MASEPKDWQAKQMIGDVTFLAFHVICRTGRRRLYARDAEAARLKVEAKMPDYEKVIKVVAAPCLDVIEGQVFYV